MPSLFDLPDIHFSIDLNRFHNFKIIHHYVCPGSTYSRRRQTAKTNNQTKEPRNTPNLSIADTWPVPAKHRNESSTLSFGFITRPFIFLCIMLLCLSRLPYVFHCKNCHHQRQFMPSHDPSHRITDDNGWSFSIPPSNCIGPAKGLGIMFRHITRGITPSYVTSING